MPIQVVVEPHDPRWAELFKLESARIAQVLEKNVVAIQHIGSTAIPTIHAKPIIDMLIEVANLDDLDAQAPALAALGYEALGEFGIPGRRYFRKDDQAGIRTHHAHAFLAGCAEAKRHLAFRDFLRAHPEYAKQYSDLKRALAAAHPDSIDRYMDGKDPFIKEMDRRAAAWRASPVR